MRPTTCRSQQGTGHWCIMCGQEPAQPIRDGLPCAGAGQKGRAVGFQLGPGALEFLPCLGRFCPDAFLPLSFLLLCPPGATGPWLSLCVRITSHPTLGRMKRATSLHPHPLPFHLTHVTHEVTEPHHRITGSLNGALLESTCQGFSTGVALILTGS